MKWIIPHDILGSPFREEVERTSGEKVSHCYQCGKCSAGCPIASEMGYTPNQIMRMIQLGMEDVVLSSDTMWLCASCLTCSVRCPREVDVAGIMDALRRLAYRKRILPEREVGAPLFNRIFLRDIELFGRLYELWLIGMFNVFSRQPFKDMAMVPRMFLKGKIALWPRRPKNLKGLRAIFKNSRREEKAPHERLPYIKALFRYKRARKPTPPPGGEARP